MKGVDWERGGREGVEGERGEGGREEREGVVGDGRWEGGVEGGRKVEEQGRGGRGEELGQNCNGGRGTLLRRWWITGGGNSAGSRV